MDRLLIAISSDWVAASRLPCTFGPAGFEIDLLAPAGTQAGASSWVRDHVPVDGGPRPTALRLLELARRYDRAIVCNESLLRALLEVGDPRATALLPAHPDALAAMLDKTRFPAAAAAAGVRVPRSTTVEAEADLAAAVEGIGAPVMLKGRFGDGGRVVRRAEDPEAAARAGESLGYPLLVESAVDGPVSLMPCLFERGRLVAAFAAEKRRKIRRFGPSSVNVLTAVDPPLIRTAERLGAAFGLHGLVSIDLFRRPDGEEPVVIEVNPRPVGQLYLGRRVGADMALALKEVMSGRFDGTPRLSRDGGAVALFPHELRRLRARHGTVGGTVRWVKSPGALGTVPWNDLRLARRQLRDLS